MPISKIMNTYDLEPLVDFRAYGFVMLVSDSIYCTYGYLKGFIMIKSRINYLVYENRWALTKTHASDTLRHFLHWLTQTLNKYHDY